MSLLSQGLLCIELHCLGCLPLKWLAAHRKDLQFSLVKFVHQIPLKVNNEIKYKQSTLCSLKFFLLNTRSILNYCNFHIIIHIISALGLGVFIEAVACPKQ